MDGDPLDPTHPAKARILLKQKKAKVVRKLPFTIKLTYEIKNPKTQKYTLGVDTGFSKLGTAVINEKDEVVYLSEVTLRNDIKNIMKNRNQTRRMRRSRNIRYRKPRWLNRKNSIRKDRYTPTLISKFNSHMKEIKFIKSILPISTINLELAKFDNHALSNPLVKYNKWMYQKGLKFGFANTKAFVLNRDKYTCQHCKTKQGTLEVHHIVFRNNGGSDEPDNLITLCRHCHRELHSGKINLNIKGLKRKNKQAAATQMNILRSMIIKKSNLHFTETYGFITKEVRQYLNLPKEHYFDGIAICYCNKINKNNIFFKTNLVQLKRCTSKGDYKRQEFRRGKMLNLPKAKIQGFRKYDTVKYFGKRYFIRGRMSIGFVILADIDLNKIDFSFLGKGRKTPKLKNLERVSSRKSWIIDQKIIQNI